MRLSTAFLSHAAVDTQPLRDGQGRGRRQPAIQNRVRKGAFIPNGRTTANLPSTRLAPSSIGERFVCT